MISHSPHRNYFTAIRTRSFQRCFPKISEFARETEKCLKFENKRVSYKYKGPQKKTLCLLVKMINEGVIASIKGPVGRVSKYLLHVSCNVIHTSCSCYLVEGCFLAIKEMDVVFIEQALL